MENARRVISKSEILDNVWDYDFERGPEHRGDLHQLPAQEGGRPGPALIHTIRRVGYTLRLPRDAMSLQKRLVALVALLLVVGLLAADVAVYASVRSFLYGQAGQHAGTGRGTRFQLSHVRGGPRHGGHRGGTLAARLCGRVPDAPRPPRTRHGSPSLWSPDSARPVADPHARHPGPAGARNLRGTSMWAATPERSGPIPAPWSWAARATPMGSTGPSRSPCLRGPWSRRSPSTRPTTPWPRCVGSSSWPAWPCSWPWA